MSEVDEKQSAWLKAMAEETRLRLVRVLAHETLNVQEMCEILQLPQPKVSRHLSVLRAAGLVTDQRDGSRVYYRLEAFDGELALVGEYVRGVASQEHPDVSRIESCLRQRSLQSHEFARQRAHEWDQISGQLHSTDAVLMALAQLAPRGLTLADLGTGTGLLLPVLSAFAEHVYAVDQSQEMIDFARQRCEQAEIDNVTFICDALEQLPDMLPRPCHCVLIHFVLHQIARPGAAIARAAKALAPGGRIVVVDRVKHDDESARGAYGSLWLGFDEQQVREWFTAAGLDAGMFLRIKTPRTRPREGASAAAEEQEAIFIAAGGLTS
jgi:DNA-binding transcriptional ArsR family regulator/ubiquinone/menaquinone biosynthesis C-methylase UbiE